MPAITKANLSPGDDTPPQARDPSVTSVTVARFSDRFRIIVMSALTAAGPATPRTFDSGSRCRTQDSVPAFGDGVPHRGHSESQSPALCFQSATVACSGPASELREPVSEVRVVHVGQVVARGGELLCVAVTDIAQRIEAVGDQDGGREIRRASPRSRT